MSYSRHAIDDRDLAMGHDVNYRVHMQVRRMMSENKARRRRQARKMQQINGADMARADINDHEVSRTRVSNPDASSMGCGARIDTELNRMTVSILFKIESIM